MKKTMNLGLVALAAASLSCGVFCDQAQAIPSPINGSIEFFGKATPSGSSPGSPISVVFTNPWHSLAGIGDYAGVPFGTAATFTNFSFTGDGTGATLSAPVPALWSFSFGGISYSLDLLSLSNGHSSSGSMAFSGSGTARATGFEDTPASWALQGAGQNFVFTLSSSTTTAAGVPEGGTTAGLFGIALFGIAIVRRQFRVA
jgi:hypothetical protein